jgi:hypothetical protein
MTGICFTMPTMTARTVEVQFPPAIAWDRLKTAAMSLGKIEEAQENSHFLILKARYGLNPVRLRVSVLSGPSAATSRLEIQGRGQDIWGVASRKVIDKLCAAL